MRYPRFLRLALPLAFGYALPYALASCAVATGAVVGGEPLFDAGTTTGSVTDGVAPAACPDASDTWTSLYTDFFGPTGVANCTSLSSCHDNPAAEGTMFGGFNCGKTKDDCYMGMTGSNCKNSAGVPCPLIMKGLDPTMTGLYLWLRRSDSTGKLIGRGNMPLNGAKITTNGHVFTPCEMQRITGWIAQGVPNN